MRILHVVAYYKPAYFYGGPIYSVGSLCERFSKSGHSVSVYTTTANGAEELDRKSGKQYELCGVKVRYFMRNFYKSAYFSPDLLYQLWKDVRKYDIVHVSGWWNLVSILGVCICLLRGVRPIVSVRGMLGGYSFRSGRIGIKKGLHLIFGRYLLHNSILHATVKNEMAEVTTLLGKVNGFVLPNFLELPPQREKVGHGDDHVKLLFLGRIHHVKNLEFLFNLLPHLDCNWRLKIGGSGEKKYLNTLIQLAARNGISQQIEWLGYLNSEDKYATLSESDIMVLLSHSENFANVVVESLSVGTAVLVSDKVGMAEYVLKHNYGKIVPLKLNEALVGLNELIKDKNLMHHTSKEAPMTVRNDFDGDGLVENYLLEYQKLDLN